MSLMDELRRLARPYEDEEEYEEDFDLEEFPLWRPKKNASPAARSGRRTTWNGITQIPVGIKW